MGGGRGTGAGETGIAFVELGSNEVVQLLLDATR